MLGFQIIHGKIKQILFMNMMYHSPYSTGYKKLYSAILDNSVEDVKSVKESGLLLSVKQYNDLVQKCLRKHSDIEILKEVTSFLVYPNEQEKSKATPLSFETLQMGLSSTSQETVECILEIAP